MERQDTAFILRTLKKLMEQGYTAKEANLMAEVRTYPEEHTPEEIKKAEALYKRGPLKV
jgi:hypothetical protein